MVAWARKCLRHILLDLVSTTPDMDSPPYMAIRVRHSMALQARSLHLGVVEEVAGMAKPSILLTSKSCHVRHLCQVFANW